MCRELPIPEGSQRRWFPQKRHPLSFIFLGQSGELNFQDHNIALHHTITNDLFKGNTGGVSFETQKQARNGHDFDPVVVAEFL